MGAFDKVIGYEHIKNELLQICDMINNRDAYEKLGAKLPQGVLMEGDPGLGKTLMASCFIEECGLKSYTIRRTKGKEAFLECIRETFQKAKDNAPAVILLDDLDKFANEDNSHQDAEEYVAVQAGIDTIKRCNVLVIATVNDIEKLPDSLIRPGRFDKRIVVNCPTDEDAANLIRHYLSDKQVSDKINVEDISKTMQHVSCAALEVILNQAAIIAASKRQETIEMEDFVDSILRMQYDSDEKNNKVPEEEMRKTAIHEAGHMVVAEVLMPESIGLVSIRQNDMESIGGFVRKCKKFNRRQEIMVALAGKVATELYDSETCASGCQSDLERATRILTDGIKYSGTNGLGFIRTDYITSDVFQARVELVAHAELEQYMFKVRDLLIKNRDFLEKAANRLFEKETLLFSDIREIRESVEIVKPGGGITWLCSE